MLFIRYRNIFFGLIGGLTLASIVLLAVFGLNLGTDFTGGALIEARYANERPAQAELTEALAVAGLENPSVRASENGYIIRSAPLSEDARTALPSVIEETGGSIERLTDVGPSLGRELRTKALYALGLVVLCIVLYVAFAFRKVSDPVSSWVYGLITIVTLIHDVLVPVGAFALFGYLWGAQVDTLFVTAVLTILGYSVHDTIVVFDRTRENLRINAEARRKEDFETVTGRAIEQTFVRSVNTSISTLLALGALFIFGPEATRDFALTLIIGVVAGTYSSIALATPLLVAYERWKKA